MTYALVAAAVLVVAALALVLLDRARRAREVNDAHFDALGEDAEREATNARARAERAAALELRRRMREVVDAHFPDHSPELKEYEVGLLVKRGGR